MKRTIRTIALLVAATLFLAACSKENTGAANATGPESRPKAEQAVSSKNSAYIMLNGLGMWTRSEDSLKYAKAAILGDRVETLGVPEKFTVDKVEREYTKVRAADGKEYYVRSPYVVQAPSLAVVNDVKCVLYNEPRVVGATKIEVPRLTIVALLDGEAMTDGYVRVSFANQQAQTMTAEKWITRSSIVLGTANVDAAVALTMVAGLGADNLERKLNILEGAIKAYADTAFYADINNVLIELQGSSKPSVIADGRTMIVNDDQVNVRSAPETSASNVVTQLSKGTVVDILERTEAEATIGGVSAPWYRISAPAAGWVFGGFLSNE